MNLEREELILATGAAEDPAVKLFIDAMENDDVRAYARAYALLLEQGSQRNFAEYLADKILFDDNVFARRAFEGKLSPDVVSAFSHDLDIFQRIADACDNPPPKIGAKLSAGFPKIYRGKNNPLFGGEWSGKRTLSKLKEFFRQNGYGIFVGNKAFTFAGGALAPVKYTSNISLYDLKDYEYEKQLVEDNIISFLKNLPYSNMLLYGDKGTGKSSTVHAVLNKYAHEGLRAVEIPKEQVKEINALKELLAELPLKFLIFIDDLSLEENDEKVTSLKASLEGSMNEKADNVMIVATSNRRHILKENFSDRENSVHARDTMEEQLSLSDRFGLTVLFSSTGKREYLSIIRQLAIDCKLGMDEEKLFSLAERWAIDKGGRSPRRAKQFIDYVFACLSKNSEIII